LLTLKSSIYEKAISLCFAVGLLLWIQGNILVRRYGLLDGREIDWDAQAVSGVIDVTLWITVIIAAFFASSLCARIVRQASLALILIQLISVALLIPQGRGKPGSHNPVANEEPIFNFSNEHNVIILVLDSLQSDYFREIINENSYYKDIFKGFTYYRNTVGGYPFTHAVVSLMLTGRYYENTVPYDEFAKEVFSSDSLPKILKKAGYQVDLLKNEDLALFYVDETIASHLGSLRHLIGERIFREEGVIVEAGFLFDVTLFRYLPHTLKRKVYNNQKWFFATLCFEKFIQESPANQYVDAWRYRVDIEFIRKMAQIAKPDSDRPTFKYIHLWIPHPPPRVNEHLKYEELERSRDGYKRQTRGALNLANMLLEALRRMGVYDKTMVFVLADHGYGQRIEMGEHTPGKDANLKISPLDKMKGAAYPLLLVKPFRATGELRVSDAPVSLSDVAKTVLSELKLDGEIPGASIFSMRDSDSRSRRFLFHNNERVYIGKDYYLAPMEEYIVSGPVWQDESWHPTNRAFAHDGVKYLPPRDR